MLAVLDSFPVVVFLWEVLGWRFGSCACIDVCVCFCVCVFLVVVAVWLSGDVAGCVAVMKDIPARCHLWEPGYPTISYSCRGWSLKPDLFQSHLSEPQSTICLCPCVLFSESSAYPQCSTCQKSEKKRGKTGKKEKGRFRENMIGLTKRKKFKEERERERERMRESHRWAQIKKATGRASRDTLKGKPWGE